VKTSLINKNKRGYKGSPVEVLEAKKNSVGEQLTSIAKEAEEMQ